MRFRLILLLLFVSLQAFPQSKNEKFLKKAEASYASGDYGKAFKNLEKFRKKVNKKLGTPNQYTPVYYLSYAKYNLASGMINEFESNLQSAITSINQSTEKTEQSYDLLIEGAKLLNLNGTYLKARLLLEQIKPAMDAAGLLKDPKTPLAAKWDVAYADALSGQGYYNEAVEILVERQPYYAGRMNKSETSVVNGALKSRKLSDEEFRQRVSDYAGLIVILGRTYDLKGEYDSGDILFKQQGENIRKATDKYSFDYLNVKYHHANLILNGGLVSSLQGAMDGEDFGTLLSKLKANHKPTHWLATKLYEAQLRIYLRDESSRYYNLKLEYEKLINKEFKSTSIYRPRLKALEYDSKLSRDKTNGLETSANNLLANSPGLPKYNEVRVNLNLFLSDLAIFQKKYNNAEAYLKAAIDIKKELLGDDAPETHLARVLYANYLIDYTNNLADADKIYLESFTNVFEKQIGPKQKDRLEIQYHIATLREMTDKYAEANAALTKAVSIAEYTFGREDWDYAAALTNVARLKIKMGEYESAEKDINTAIEILSKKDVRKRAETKVYMINAIDTQAVLFGIKGLFDEAQDALDKSAKMIEKADVLIGIDELATARELSSLLIQLGRLSETDDILIKLIKDYEKLYGPNTLRLIDPLVNLGRLTLLNGDYTEADKIAQRANNIAVKIYGEVSTKTAPTQKLLADIDYMIGDYPQAEENIAKALASQQKQFGRNHIEVAKCLSQLALIKFYNHENKKEVEKLMLESRDIMGAKLGKENPQYAEILKNVAILYISENRFDIAFSSLTQAEQIWRAKTGRKRNINAASIYSLTGDVYYQQKNYVKAEEFYNKAKSLYEQFFSSKHPEYVRVLSKQAKVYYMEKDYKRAKKNIEEALANYESFIKQFFPALSDREKSHYWKTIQPDFEFYNTLAFSQLEDFRDLTGKVYNYQLLTKALLLNNSIKTRERILNSKDEALIQLYNDWLQKKEFLTSVLSMSTQQLTDNGINPEALSAEVERIEKQLSERSELFGQSFENKKITYENVQKSLNKTEVAVEIVRYRNFNHSFTDSIMYVALYVKNDNARPKAVILKEGYRMENRWMRYYRNSIVSRTEDKFSYKIFWEPIQKEVGTYSTIFISPDGVYNQINLEAIPTPDGKYVIDNSNIILVSNTKDLYLRKLKSKTVSTGPSSATMFGNPTYYVTASSDGRVTQLPGTDREVRGLDQLLKQQGWKTSEYLENDATEEQVKQVDSPSVLHIATHGFYTPAIEASELEQLTQSEAQMSENPLLKTGLLLKGAGDLFTKTKYNYNMESGILTAAEAMNLSLDKTDLVVLSACETGLGDIHMGEGVYGLQRAFLVAGAKVLIMSMFKVDDGATQKLVNTFYSKWTTTKNLRQSFVDAKKEIRTEYPDPVDWGAFMMIGLD